MRSWKWIWYKKKEKYLDATEALMTKMGGIKNIKLVNYLRLPHSKHSLRYVNRQQQTKCIG
jgi:hypothetical protein